MSFEVLGLLILVLLLVLERDGLAGLSTTFSLTSSWTLLSMRIGSSPASSSASSSISCSGSNMSVSGVLGRKAFGADDCLSKRVQVEVGDAADGEAKKSWAPCELTGIDLTLLRGLRGCLSP